MEVTHIHEVLHLIYNAGSHYTTTSLINTLKSTYGEDVKFTTCGDHFLSIDEALQFIQDRGKVKLEGDQIVPIGDACSH